MHVLAVVRGGKITDRFTYVAPAIGAGDPHRQLEMPNMYGQAHVACEDFDVIGLTVPGVPDFPHLGHTENVAGRCRPLC